MNGNEIQKLDAKHLWHPCSNMKDYELFKPLVIKGAYGSYFELADGRKIIDAISSWWCKSLGHNHPKLKKALIKQLDQFEHVILANTSNEVIARLSEQLSMLIPGLNKVFYASDGSSAVEIALKMSLHARIIEGKPHKNRFIALKNGYHGETLGALSVSDVGIYRAPYSSVLFSTEFLEVPYVSSTNEAEWHDSSQAWNQIQEKLELYRHHTTAIILEPILQGAAGMRLYSQDFLSRLSSWAKAHDIHLIADEIMTGIGRTGKMLACEHANITPDFICVSKGLTSGFLPLSAVITTDEIYQQFYDDHERGKAFLHSHTYSGNALAASVALETLSIIKKENLCIRAEKLQSIMINHLSDIAKQTEKLENIRGIGAVVAADLITHPKQHRPAFKFFQEAIKRGAFLRPIANTIYWLPPLTIEEATLAELKQITLDAINA